MSIDHIELLVMAVMKPSPPAVTTAPPLFGVPIVQHCIESIANGRPVHASSDGETARMPPQGGCMQSIAVSERRQPAETLMA